MRTNIPRCVVIALFAVVTLAAQSTVVTLNADNNYTDEIEPGVTIARDGPGPAGFGGGPLLGTNVEFSCGSCDVATFLDSVPDVGGGAGPICGFTQQVPKQILVNDLKVCFRSLLSGNKYELDLLTWSDGQSVPFPGGGTQGTCYDADDGCTCGATGSRATYVRCPAGSCGPAPGAACQLLGAGGPDGCSSTAETVADLIAEVNALSTSDSVKNVLTVFLGQVQEALDKGKANVARSVLGGFIFAVTTRSNLGENNPNRILEEEANSLICGASNVLTSI